MTCTVICSHSVAVYQPFCPPTTICLVFLQKIWFSHSPTPFFLFLLVAVCLPPFLTTEITIFLYFEIRGWPFSPSLLPSTVRFWGDLHSYEVRCLLCLRLVCAHYLVFALITLGPGSPMFSLHSLCTSLRKINTPLQTDFIQSDALFIPPFSNRYWAFSKGLILSRIPTAEHIVV